MISFYIQGAILVGLFIYHRLTEDAVKRAPSTRAEVPRTDEGAPLPFIYGRCRVRAPVLAWIGNWQVVPRGSTGFAYLVDMLFVVGIPFYGGSAQLLSIYAGDFFLSIFPLSLGTVGHPGPGRSTFRSLNASEVYGGDTKGGGIFGDIEFFDGRPDQQLSDYINDVDPNNWTILQTRQTFSKFFSGSTIAHPSLIAETLMPGYRNQAVCLMFNWEIGEAPNFTSYSFDVRCLSTGTASDLGFSLANDADPAAVILDLLTSPWGKLGIPLSKVDVPSFQAASATLFTEVHGYSRAIDEVDEATAIIEDILKQIDAMIYEEPTTGKLVLKLIRNDYDIDGLDDINPSNASAPDSGWFSVQGWNETFNQVRVSFTDRQNNYTDGLRIAQNSANAAGQADRALRSTDLQFVGCCDGLLAERLAARELAIASRPAVRATLTVNRNFYQARPGSVYTLTWPELGVDRMVMRVVRVDLGQLHQGQIRLEMIRDVFDVTDGAFPAP